MKGISTFKSTVLFKSTLNSNLRPLLRRKSTCKIILSRGGHRRYCSKRMSKDNCTNMFPMEHQRVSFIKTQRILYTKAPPKIELIILPTQTRHHYRGNPSKLPYVCIV